MFFYLNTYDFYQNMISNDLLSYAVIKVELVCNLLSISMSTEFLFYLSALWSIAYRNLEKMTVTPVIYKLQDVTIKTQRIYYNVTLWRLESQPLWLALHVMGESFN